MLIIEFILLGKRSAVRKMLLVKLGNVQKEKTGFHHSTEESNLAEVGSPSRFAPKC